MADFYDQVDYLRHRWFVEHLNNRLIIQFAMEFKFNSHNSKFCVSSMKEFWKCSVLEFSEVIHMNRQINLLKVM